MRYVYAVFAGKSLLGVFSSARKAEEFSNAQKAATLSVIRLTLNEKLGERSFHRLFSNYWRRSKRPSKL